jgi:AhpD family alkylhydroperoxidase
MTRKLRAKYDFAMRISLKKTAPGILEAMAALEHYTRQSTLERPLLELVKIRASQINGCAFCLDMHTQDARAAGETEQRLHLISAWNEAPFFNDRERAALAWTEAVTLVSETQAPDELYQRLRPHFSEKEIADLTFTIAAINAWNRLMIAFRVPAGIYKPKAPVAAG